MPPNPRKSPVVDLDKPRGGSDSTRRPTSKAECNSLVAEKNGSFKLSDHLSSLLFSDDVLATVIEASTIIALFVLSYWRGSAAVLDVAGSASFKQITWVFVGKRCVLLPKAPILARNLFAFADTCGLNDLLYGKLTPSPLLFSLSIDTHITVC
jgi:hypothetical protein